MRIFNACTTTVLLYGCESWALKEEDARRLAGGISNEMPQTDAWYLTA